MLDKDFSNTAFMVDLDGTFINAWGRGFGEQIVSDEHKALAHDIYAQGGTMVLSTGRVPFTCKQIINETEKQGKMHIVACNGSYVETADGRVLRDARIKPSTIRKLINFIESIECGHEETKVPVKKIVLGIINQTPRINLKCDGSDSELVKADYVQTPVEQILGCTGHRIDVYGGHKLYHKADPNDQFGYIDIDKLAFEASLSQANGLLLMSLAGPEASKELARLVSEKFGAELNYVNAYEITPAGVDKKTGLELLLKDDCMKGRDNLVAIGDGQNDLPMLELAPRNAFMIENDSESPYFNNIRFKSDEKLKFVQWTNSLTEAVNKVSIQRPDNKASLIK